MLFSFQSYDNFIEKTKAELNKEPDSTPDTKSQIIDSISIAEQSSIKSPVPRYQNSCKHDTLLPTDLIL